MAAKTVQVHLFAAARAAVGQPHVEVTGDTLAEVCLTLETQYPDFAKVRQQCSFLVDEVAVHGDPAAVALPAGARVDVLPPFAGGAL
jgi:molybdopterin synthase sulfur carrier subunit